MIVVNCVFFNYFKLSIYFKFIVNKTGDYNTKLEIKKKLKNVANFFDNGNDYLSFI